MRLSVFIKKSTMFLLLVTSSVYSATINVTGTDGSVADDGDCSISEAIIAANTDNIVFAATGECNAGSGADTINLSADVTLTARFNGNEGGNGTPYITGAILLDGNGFSIARSNAATEEFRILFVAATGDLDLRNITLSNGLVTGFDGGGAIENVGTISRIQNSTFSGNQARYGGAIENYNVSNTANTGIIQNSTFSGNSAVLYGGGVYSNSTITTIQNSTFSENEAESGGGIYIYEGVINAFQNTTFSGNSAVSNGAGIRNDNATINMLRNSLFHQNTGGGTECANLNGTLNGSNNLSDNLVSDCPGVSTLTTTTIGPLADNGGSTMTHALLPGSEAIDAGNGDSTTSDQRGFAALNTRDIGAFEVFVPVVMAPTDVSVEATGPLTSPALGVALVTDTDNPGLIAAPSQSVNFVLGTTSILWAATDSYGYTGTDSQDVTIVDTTPPIITAPTDITMEATGTLTTVALGTATATDLVDGTLPVISDAPVSFPVAVTTVIWSATDSGGLIGVDTQLVTIEDTTAPVISITGDNPLNLNEGDTFVDQGATASDSVDGTIVATASGSVDTSIAGSYNITYQATDSQGNTASAIRVVIVNPVDVVGSPTPVPMGNLWTWLLLVALMLGLSCLLLKKQ